MDSHYPYRRYSDEKEHDQQVLDEVRRERQITAKCRRHLRLAIEAAAEFYGTSGLDTVDHWFADLLISFAEEHPEHERWLGRYREPGYPEYPSSPSSRPLPNGLRMQVYERDGYKCVLCGSSSKLVTRHVVPKSKGGESTLDNLRTVCDPCSRKLGKKGLEDIPAQASMQKDEQG